MAHIEIDSFVSKFKSLVSAGVKASLKFNSLNSEVSVALEANLGSLPVKTWCSLNNSPRRGPSYFRRQQKRREEASGNNSGMTLQEADNAEKIIIDEAAELNVKMKENIQDNAPEVSAPGNEINEINAVEANDQKNDVNVANNAYKVDEVSNKKSIVAEEAHVKKNGLVQDPPEFDAAVHGTAVIVDSSSSQVSKDMYKAVWGIVDSKDHIKRNVGQIRVVNVRSTEDINGKFRHELQMTFTVNSSRLWDSPRCYLWKHLGNSEWKLPDSSRVSFVRVHQK